MSNWEKELMEEFDQWQEAWEGQNVEKESIREASLKDFIVEGVAKQRTQLLNSCKKEIDELKLKYAEEVLQLQKDKRVRGVPKK